MGYANPKQRTTYSFGKIDFATSTSTRIKGPKGLVGRLIEVQVDGDTLFTAVTTPAHVKVGTAGNAAAYYDGVLPALAADAVWSSSQDQAIPNATADLPADTDIKINFTAPTGGTPAGRGYVQIICEWF